jgi:hypothetical protein
VVRLGVPVELRVGGARRPARCQIETWAAIDAAGGGACELDGQSRAGRLTIETTSRCYLPERKVDVILSVVESIGPQQPLPRSADAREAFHEAAEAKRQFARELRLPRGYSVIAGAGNAVFIFAVALGNSEWRFASLAFVTGLVVQVFATGIASRRFKRLNGAWVSGFGGPRATWSVIGLFAASLIALIVASTWLMVDSQGVLSALVALCALPLTTLGDRWWMARYRAAHA